MGIDMNTRARMKANALVLSDRQIILKFKDGIDYIGGNHGMYYIGTHLLCTARYSYKKLLEEYFRGKFGQG